MYSGFQKHDVETAPEKSKPLLRQLLEHSGPNGFYAVTAESPETLTAYATLHKAFMASSFTDEEKTVIWQSINVENQCHFCVPAHTYMAKAMRIDKVYQMLCATKQLFPRPGSKLYAILPCCCCVIMGTQVTMKSQSF